MIIAILSAIIAIGLSGVVRADEPAHDGIRSGVATVNVAVDGTYICQGPYAKNALLMANDPTARARIGDLNYMQALIQNGCFQVNRGTTLTIYALSEKKSRSGIVVSPLGKVGLMADFTDWFSNPLWKSTLHTACHTTSDATSTSTTCGLEY